MSDNISNTQNIDGQQTGVDQQDEQQRSLQHPHLPSNLVSGSEQQDNAILQATLDAAGGASASDHAQSGQVDQTKQEEQSVASQPQQQDENVGQDFTNQTEQDNTAANFFDQSYQQYEFPTSSAALAAASNAAVSSFEVPFHPHPHPQHPHLGVEALGHAAAASQHAGRVPVPGVSAPEGDGGNHVFNGNGADHSMDMTMSSTAGDTTTASVDQSGQQDRSSGKAARTSLSVPGSDGSGKKETPYSRSPDMRNSHKLAERKRRKEMKDLFDDLRDQLPVDRGPKTSKWEILSKAVDHIKEIRKERDAFASELNSLRGGEDVSQQMTGVEDGGVAPPPPAPEDGTAGTNDDYTKYEQQQVTSQQQVEAAAAAANQFTAHHDFSQPTHEEHNVHQEVDYKPQDEQSAHEAVQDHQVAEQDWSAIAAQAQAQAQAQSAQ